MSVSRESVIRRPDPAASPDIIAPVRLDRGDFDRLCGLVKEKAGIHLGPDKLALVQARLGKRLRKLGLTSFRDYHERLVGPSPDPVELHRMIDAVSTHTTAFFREEAHFEVLARHLGKPGFLDASARILSAGCSTGEEPFSIAMCIQETLGEAGGSRVVIEAGDISLPVLRQASHATYPMSRVEGLSRPRMHRFFLKGTGPMEGHVRLVPTIRRMVTFRAMNLVTGDGIGARYCAIFCRNVTIYFDRPTQVKVFRRLAGLLEPGGLLFVGHSESLLSVVSELQFLRPSVYVRT